MMQEKVAKSSAEINAVSTVRAAIESERDSMLEKIKSLELAVAEGSVTTGTLEEERRRARGLQEQRDVAKRAVKKMQEQLTQALERLSTSEERRRGAEAAIKDAKGQLEDGGKWEAKCRELERERTKLNDALLRATAESKAVAEREQVLLHRIALRERLVNVDWSRGTEVVHELRAESARGAAGDVGPGGGGRGRSGPCRIVWRQAARRRGRRAADEPGEQPADAIDAKRL